MKKANLFLKAMKKFLPLPPLPCLSRILPMTDLLWRPLLMTQRLPATRQFMEVMVMMKLVVKQVGESPLPAGIALSDQTLQPALTRSRTISICT